MSKAPTGNFSPKEKNLDNILLAMENVTFGKRVSATIVGGEKKLEDMIAQGKIRAEKRSNFQSGKWFCNAADVLRNCREMTNR